jgi:hypothetical protein
MHRHNEHFLYVFFLSLCMMENLVVDVLGLQVVPEIAAAELPGGGPRKLVSRARLGHCQCQERNPALRRATLAISEVRRPTKRKATTSFPTTRPPARQPHQDGELFSIAPFDCHVHGFARRNTISSEGSRTRPDEMSAVMAVRRLPLSLLRKLLDFQHLSHDDCP